MTPLITTPNSCGKMYDAHLKEISGVAITRRQAEVMACVLHNRGDKKIAAILGIGPRTASTHIRDILNKFGYNSREQIIDVIEKSGKLHYIKEFYLHLLIYSTFQIQLQKIGALINRQSIKCIIDFDTKFDHNKRKQLFTEHLNFANITLTEASNSSKNKIDLEKNEHYLYFLGAVTNANSDNTVKNIALLFDQNIDSKLLQNIDYIDFRDDQDYYFSILELVKNIINQEELESIIVEFKDFYRAVTSSGHNDNGDLIASARSSSINNKQILTIISIIIFSLLIIVTFLIFSSKNLLTSANYNQANDHYITKIRSSLRLPTKLLKRSHVHKLIDQAFITNNPIKIVALTGVGGAGKTTLARQYAKNTNAPLIWEIHAEDKDSIINSFMNLASVLAKTENDKKEIQIIQDTISKSDRIEKLGQFITDNIQHYHNWLLIYDDVQNIQEIEPYLPCDSDVWGQGKVIITSRNHNIASSIFIDQECAIALKKLSLLEKQEIFDQIVPKQTKQGEDKKRLLAKLPPFPLDIITAAYYIKVNNVSYKSYIALLDKNDCDAHDQMHRELIQDIGLYNNTRYNIITSSIKDIIKQDKEYQHLLLLISMINYKNIPKHLLISYKGDVIADKFVNALRKYSLVTTMKTDNTNMGIAFNMHPALQELMFFYLQKNLELDKNNPLIQKTADALECYIAFESEKQTTETKKVMLLHFIQMLQHETILTDHIKMQLGHLISCYYRFTLDYDNAEKYLKNVLSLAKLYFASNSHQMGSLLSDLSIIHRDTGNYEKAEEIMQQSIKIMQHYYSEHHVKLIEYYTRLGNIYFSLGNITKSQQYLEQSWQISKSHYGINNDKNLLVLIYLSKLYVDIGQYDKAREILEKTISRVEHIYGAHSYRTSTILSSLGLLYIELGLYDDAKPLLQNALNIVINYSHDKHFISAWYMAYFARYYQAIGNFQEAEKLLVNAFAIIETAFGKNHIEMAHIKHSLGNLYLAKSKFDSDDLKKSEELLTQAYQIFNDNGHYKRFACLELLSDLYLQRGDKKQSEYYLTESLKIAQKSLPSDSSHIQRLVTKIAKIQHD